MFSCCVLTHQQAFAFLQFLLVPVIHHRRVDEAQHDLVTPGENMKPEITQPENMAVLESQQEPAGAAKKLKVRRQTARMLKQASVKPESALRHEAEGFDQQDVCQRITARFVFAEPTTEEQDQASFNAIQNALRKLLLDRGYDLAAIAGANQADSNHTAAKTTLLDETR